jgi:hypothetical protein
MATCCHLLIPPAWQVHASSHNQMLDSPQILPHHHWQSNWMAYQNTVAFHQHCVFDPRGFQLHFAEKQQDSRRCLLAIFGKVRFLYKERICTFASCASTNLRCSGNSDVWFGKLPCCIFYCLIQLALQFFCSSSQSAIPVLILGNVHAWGHWKTFGWSSSLSSAAFVSTTSYLCFCNTELSSCSAIICFHIIVNYR